VAAAIMAGLIAAGPSLAAGPAYAADGQTVTFTGGSVAGLLVCKSQPNSSRVNVAAESRVTFANRLNQTATLRVDGAAVATVGADQAVPLVFHHGPVRVSMTFSCSAGVVEQFSAASVNVASRSAAPAPVPAAPTGGGNTGSNGGGYSRNSGGGTATHNGAPDAARAGTTGGGTATGGSPRSGSEGTGGARPGAAASDPAALAGEPSADPSAPALTDPALGDPTAPTGTSGEGGNAVAVEPMIPASDGPTSASGLLALVAAVCAIGVTMAAMRAMILKRTLRASLA
jgi:hypothetical protein